MRTRFALAALLVAAVMVPALADQATQSGQTLSATRTCQFQVHVPAILQVSDCRFTTDQSGAQIATIDVTTNAPTSVSLSTTAFTRTERDLDGKALSTVDTLNNALAVNFNEIIHCADGGSALQVRNQGNNNFLLAPHRGGFQIVLSSSPTITSDICDDAGCFTATVSVVITPQPVEDCAAPTTGQ